MPEPLFINGGRYWDRTSDLFGVNEARYRCANRPARDNVSPSDGWAPISKLPKLILCPRDRSAMVIHAPERGFREGVRTWLSW